MANPRSGLYFNKVNSTMRGEISVSKIAHNRNEHKFVPMAEDCDLWCFHIFIALGMSKLSKGFGTVRALVQ